MLEPEKPSMSTESLDPIIREEETLTPSRAPKRKKRFTDEDKARITLEKLRQVFSRYDYPITAAFVAAKLEVPKGAVNSFISSNRNHFDRYECQPPLWRFALPLAADG